MKCVAIRFYGDSDILLKHSGSRDQTHNNLSSQIKLRNKGISKNADFMMKMKELFYFFTFLLTVEFSL